MGSTGETVGFRVRQPINLVVLGCAHFSVARTWAGAHKDIFLGFELVPMNDDREFWLSQTSSLHRYSDSEFFERKAEEHVFFIRSDHRDLEFIDLGCGAGELLFHLCRRLKYVAAIDYSPSMLAVARETMAGHPVNLVCATPGVYLREHEHPAWTTTGAVNQYLDPVEQFALLDIFLGSDSAKVFYMFDCVDPLRYQLQSLGVSYQSIYVPALKTLGQRARWFYRTVRSVSILARRWSRYDSSEHAVRLHGRGMGWGYLPAFWIALAERHGLSARFASSSTYEYRYHVALTKPESR